MLGLTSTDTQKRPTHVASPLLHKDLDGRDRMKPWNYRSVIGMLTCIQVMSRPDTSMAVHKCVRYSSFLNLSHKRVVPRIARYLINTKNRSIIYKEDNSRCLECFVDAEFAGGWNPRDTLNQKSMFSRTGFVIACKWIPIFWRSKLQTEIALSTFEAEHIALSAGMREVMPLLELLKDLNDMCDVITAPPIVTCKVFEDNQSCIAMAESKKPSIRTKHVAIKHHHFRSLVVINVNYMNTKKHLAETLTKPIENNQFFKLRCMLIC